MRALLVAALIAAVAAAPAEAARVPDREGARGVAEASKQLRAAMLAQKDVIEAGVRLIERDPMCDQAIRGVPSHGKAFGAAVDLLVTYQLQAMLWPIRGPSARFQADLAAVRLRDPVLRSGRAAQRRMHRLSERVSAPASDICAQLDAWRLAGYPAARAPKPAGSGLDPFFSRPNQVERDTRLIDRAGRRLRALGVSKQAVRYWNGDDLWDGIYDGRELRIGRPAGG